MFFFIVPCFPLRPSNLTHKTFFLHLIVLLSLPSADLLLLTMLELELMGFGIGLSLHHFTFSAQIRLAGGASCNKRIGSHYSSQCSHSLSKPSFFDRSSFFQFTSFTILPSDFTASKEAGTTWCSWPCGQNYKLHLKHNLFLAGMARRDNCDDFQWSGKLSLNSVPLLYFDQLLM